jgi:transcription antitermination protein NusB
MNRGNRRLGRELALKIVYSLPDQSGSIHQVLKAFWENFSLTDDGLVESSEEINHGPSAKARHFSEVLACGVADHQDEIDRQLKAFSTNWSLERMARVDLSILRLAVFELLFCPDVPTSVVINEAIEIGKRFGTRETPAFVNGILDKISTSARSPSENKDKKNNQK